MRRLNISLACLIFSFLVACNASSDGLIDKINIFDIGKKVQILFSPNVFEAFSYKLERMADVVNNPKFKKNRPTVVYIHGWLGDGEFEESVMAVRNAYRERDDHNILVVDWSAYSKWHVPVPYKSSISKLKVICETVAEQLDLIRTRGHDFYKNIYLAGHSLGGQCTGLIARTVKKISGGKFVIPKIYALDPAGPGFEFRSLLGIRGFDCISKSDATYVQVIHTNGGQLGVLKAIGHSDFFVNGGSEQPGCTSNSCSHQRAWIYFQETIKDPKSYLARKCDSYHDFLNGYCDNNAIQNMGYSSNETLPMGTYYFRTHPSQFVTSMGADGLKNTKFVLTNQDGTTSDGVIPFSYYYKLMSNINMDKYIDSFNNNF